MSYHYFIYKVEKHTYLSAGKTHQKEAWKLYNNHIPQTFKFSISNQTNKYGNIKFVYTYSIYTYFEIKLRLP